MHQKKSISTLLRFPFIVFLFINLLFVLKYGTRQDHISENILYVGYVFFVSAITSLIISKQEFINKQKQFKMFFWMISISFFFVIIFINYLIDGNTLNTDRWSALDTVISNVLEGEYPYNKLNHLNQTSSNLPGLFYIVLPFYLLGNIGVLQAFVFLFLAVFLWKSKYQNYQKLLILVLFLVSPAYWWEVFAKSDLMSNIIIVLLFVLIWYKKYHKNYFKNKPLLAFFIALFVLTRGVVIIPLTLFLLRSFVALKIKEQSNFIFWFLFFLILISTPFLVTIPDLITFKEHNPFNHQTAFMPKVLQILMVVTPLFLSFKVSGIQSVINYTFLVYAFSLITTVLLHIYEDGYKNTIITGLSDISYLGMILPFAIFIFSLSNKKNIMHA